MKPLFSSGSQRSWASLILAPPLLPRQSRSPATRPLRGKVCWGHRNSLQDIHGGAAAWTLQGQRPEPGRGGEQCDMIFWPTAWSGDSGWPGLIKAQSSCSRKPRRLQYRSDRFSARFDICARRLDSTSCSSIGPSRSFHSSTSRRIQDSWQEPPQINKTETGVAKGNAKSDKSHGTPLTSRTLKENLRMRLANIGAHENIYTIPNILTVSRLIAAPVIGYLVVHGHDAWAVALFAYAGITDLVDGWIARTWRMQSVVGTVIDPMADKILMAILVVSLAAKGTLPLWLFTLIFGRDACLGLAAIYYRYTSLAPPKTFARYWDFSLPSAEVRPTTISKLNTALQLGLIGGTLALPLASPYLAPGTAASALHAAQLIVAATTAWSGLSYVWSKDAVRILGKDEKLKQKQGFRGRMIIGGSFGAVLVVAGLVGLREQRDEEARKTDVSDTSQ